MRNNLEKLSENHIELTSVKYRYMGKGSKPSMNSKAPPKEKMKSSSTDNHRIKKILLYPELQLVEIFRKSYSKVIPVDKAYSMNRRDEE